MAQRLHHRRRTRATRCRTVERLWAHGVATTIDLLGEATVTEEEADRYARRCEETLRDAARGVAALAAAPAAGARPPARCRGSTCRSRSPRSRRCCAPTAPERGIAGAEPRLRHLLRVARDAGAHLHVDMESFDTREAITELTLDAAVRAGVRRRARPPASSCRPTSTESPAAPRPSCSPGPREHPRTHPFTIRLVKGAYWDHETVQAAQHGWTPPVFTDRRACDRNFEELTQAPDRRRRPTRPRRDRLAQPALDRRTPPPTPTRAVGNDVEFQVLRGLGDDTQAALAATGRRVRCYCPVGDLVAGMAYLVRRLLENTANDSFLPPRPRAATSPPCWRPMSAPSTATFANEPLLELRRAERARRRRWRRSPRSTPRCRSRSRC